MAHSTSTLLQQGKSFVLNTMRMGGQCSSCVWKVNRPHSWSISKINCCLNHQMHWLCKALCKNGFTNNLHKFVLLVLHEMFWPYARESKNLTSHVFLDEISASVSIFHERRHMISAASLAVSKFTVSSKISGQKKTSCISTSLIPFSF